MTGKPSGEPGPAVKDASPTSETSPGFVDARYINENAVEWSQSIFMEEEPTPLKQKCKQCHFWVKYGLFGINFIVWVAGIILMAIGLWARLEKEQIAAFDSFTLDPAYFLVAVGSVMFITSVFGCIGSLRENICLLKMFIIIIACIFVVEIIVGALSFVFMERVEQSLTHHIRRAILNYQDNIDLKRTLDYVQRKFSCCGAKGYGDWEMNIYYNCSSPAETRCSVPMTCCKAQNNALCGYQTRIYGERYAQHSIYTKGCISPLMIVFKDNIVIIGLIAFAVGFIELFAIVLAHALIKHILLVQKQFTEAMRLQLHPGIVRGYDAIPATQQHPAAPPGYNSIHGTQ